MKTVKMKFIYYLLAAIVIISCDMTSKKSNKPPNIIIIFTDDQGYGDLSSYGSKTINTPNIDNLGAGGAIFSDFLTASSTCSPTRAALLTGAYPTRTGVNEKKNKEKKKNVMDANSIDQPELDQENL
jgi:arylsulfatase A